MTDDRTIRPEGGSFEVHAEVDLPSARNDAVSFESEMSPETVAADGETPPMANAEMATSESDDLLAGLVEKCPEPISKLRGAVDPL